MITINSYAKNFKIALPRPNLNLESTKVNSVSDYILLFQLTRGLVNYNTSGEIVADIAESWTISSDFKNYKFKLKDNQKFSDNSNITSKHICNTILRTQKVQKIVHYNLANLKGCKAINANEVEIELKDSDVYFIKALEHPEFRILSDNDCIAEIGKQNFEITSGAYRLDSKDKQIKLFSLNRDSFPNIKNAPEKIEFIDSQNIFTDNKIFTDANVDIAWTPTDLSKAFVQFAIENKYALKIPRLSFSFWFSINPNKITSITERRFLQKILNSENFNFDNFDHRLKPSKELYLSDGPGRLNSSELQGIWKNIKSAKFSKTIKSLDILLDKNYPFVKDIEKILTQNKIKYNFTFYKNFSEYAEIIKDQNKFDIVQANNDFSSLDLTGSIKVSLNKERPLILTNKKDSIIENLLKSIDSGANKNASIAKLESYLLKEAYIIPSHYLDILILYNKETVNLDDWLKAVPEIAIWKSKVIKN